MACLKKYGEGNLIYLVEVENFRFIKIGYSANDDVSVRISQLQTGNPHQINPVFCVDGTLRQEQALHAAMAAAMLRIRIGIPGNEWYPGRHPIIKEMIEALRSGPNQAMAFLDKYHASVKQPSPNKPDLTPNIKIKRKCRSAA